MPRYFVARGGSAVLSAGILLAWSNGLAAQTVGTQSGVPHSVTPPLALEENVGRSPGPRVSRVQGRPSRDERSGLLTDDLVVDPVVTFASFLGGSGWDQATAVATGTNDTVVVAGTTTCSEDFPATPRRPTPAGYYCNASDAFVARFDSRTSELLSVFVFGGSDADSVTDVALDAAGNIYVVGETSSDDFPVTSVLGNACGTGAREAWIAEVSSDGTRLLAAACLGGSGGSGAYAVAVDAGGNPIVVGKTSAPDFPIVRAVFPVCASCSDFRPDGFVTKIAADLRSLIFSTYLGGQRDDNATGVATDASGRVVVSGITESTTFPVAMPLYGSACASGATPPPPTSVFLARFSPVGQLLVSTCLGERVEEFARVAVDSAGIAYVAFATESTALDTPGAFRGPSLGGSDVLVASVDLDLPAIRYAAYVGGSDWEHPNDIAVDAAGRAFVVGVTRSGNFDVLEPLQATTPTMLLRSVDGGSTFLPVPGLPDGEIRDLVWDPTSPSTVYARSASGLVLRSTDEGRTWTRRGTVVAYRDLVIDPSVPTTLYAVGSQVSVSRDAGASWTVLFDSYAVAGVFPTTLAADPGRPGRLLVGTSDGAYLTTDGGANWSRASGLPDRSEVLSLIVDPSRGLAFAGTRTGVYASADGGKTWYEPSIAGQPGEVRRVLASAGKPSVLYAQQGSRILKSADGGARWTVVNTPTALAGATLKAVAAFPVESVYIITEPYSILYRSIDGGASWTRLPWDHVTGDAWDFAPSPASATILAGADTEPDGFLVVLSSDGRSLVHATTLGSAGYWDDAQGVATDARGGVHVAGSSDLPTWLPVPGLPTLASRSDPSTFVRWVDAFVARIDLLNDADADGMPDFWERRMGLDPTVDDGGGDPDQDGLTNAAEFARGLHPRGFHRQYFAEGATGGFFDTGIALFNPSPTVIASAALGFLTASGRAAHETLMVPPLTRRTVLPRNVDRGDPSGLEREEFATVIESDQPLVAARAMTWSQDAYGSSAAEAIAAPSSEWYFAEGATGGPFDLFYLVENPQAAATTVRFTFLRADGQPPVEREYVLAGQRRLTVWVDLVPGLENAEVAAIVRSDPSMPIVVERAMYGSIPGEPFAAGHASPGVETPALTWHLAEGATGAYFDTFLLILNPTAQEALVEVRYLLWTGAVVTKTYRVPASSRRTIWVDYEDARLAATEFSTSVRSTNGVPIVVERAMWWPGPTPATWEETHCAMGTTAPGPRMALADGEAGGEWNATTYVLVANTSPVAGEIEVTLAFETGERATKTFVMAPSSRRTIGVKDETWTWSGPPMAPRLSGRFGVVVTSVGPAAIDVVVEGAVYHDAIGTDMRLHHWAAGRCSRAAPQ